MRIRKCWLIEIKRCVPLFEGHFWRSMGPVLLDKAQSTFNNEQFVGPEKYNKNQKNMKLGKLIK